MEAAGLDGRVQVVLGDLVNAIEGLHGSGDGSRITVYAPLDTAWCAGFSMGVTDAGSLRRLTDLLIRAIVDLASQTRADAGLP
jgi:hypothetical protein